MTAGFSLRGLLVALGIVALGLPVAFAGLFGVIAQIDRSNLNVRLVREAQLNAADLRRLQSDEETSVRGFVATGDPTFLASYHLAVDEFPVHTQAIADALNQSTADARAVAALAGARSYNARWRTEFAERAIAKARDRISDRRAAAYLDAFRNNADILAAVFIAGYHQYVAARDRAARLAGNIGFGALGVVALQVLVYAFLVDRLRGELVRERRVVSLLARAFSSEIVNDTRLDVGATYVSATRGATVGGDVYDIFPLDADRTLIVIADVSGKGVEAAVDSTFVKYGLRAFASEHTDIATIVTRFNSLYNQARKPPEAFVELFAGIYDHRTAALRYVNAGHESAYVKRPAGIERLAPTGTLVGVMEHGSFAAAQTIITADDLLLLSTDGLTEARDPSGAFLTGPGVETWLSEAGTTNPQRVVDVILGRLRRYTRNRSSDDLAILVMRPTRSS